VDGLIAVPLGAGLGFLIGLTGVGGGVLVAPALYVVLGLSYQEAISLSLIYSLFTKIVGAVQHVRQGTVLWKITLLYGLTGVPGAVLGSHAIYRMGSATERIFPYVMAALLVTVALLILLETLVRKLARREKPFSPDVLTPAGIAAIAAFQLLVGALLGITSVGSGSLVILSMLYLFRMTAQQIVGSNLVIALIMVIPAGLTHLGLGGTNVSLLLLLMVGSVVGTVIGARTALRLPQSALKLVIVVLILVGAVATVVKAAQIAH
jgi:uncharacterized membrane protein YfcA